MKRDALDRGLLASVSRSFYLSMRFLPAGMRAPVSLAYLLARAADTIADTASQPVALRLELLDLFAACVKEIAADGGADSSGAGADFSAETIQPESPGERVLLVRLGEILTALRQAAPDDRAAIGTVLGHIIRGQRLDLERFPDPAILRTLPDARTLGEYTFLVAGCVGEFWTDALLRHCAGAARIEAGELRETGIRFGKGLQLVNILRDLPGDMKEGRCYLPADELTEAGAAVPLTFPEADADWAPVHAVRRVWLDRARQGMGAGLAYARSVRGFRLRFTVYLPALIGQATLDLLEAQPDSAPPVKAKVTRKEVKRLMLRAARLALFG